MPAVTDPPGLLMYSQMSAASSSPSRYSSWAQIWLAISSLTSVPSSTTRFFSSRLKTSLRGSIALSSAWGAIMSAGYRHRSVALWGGGGSLADAEQDLDPRAERAPRLGDPGQLVLAGQHAEPVGPLDGRRQPRLGRGEHVGRAGAAQQDALRGERADARQGGDQLVDGVVGGHGAQPRPVEEVAVQRGL